MASLGAVGQWDQQYDLVIAGFGLAGMCAAIETARQGQENPVPRATVTQRAQ